MIALPLHMRGAILTGPQRIEVRDVPVPRPTDGEIVLKVTAATTCGTDVKVYRRGGHPRMLKVPTLFGHEMAGCVAALGDGVTSVAVGDRVVVANSAPCLVCPQCQLKRHNLCEDLHYLNGAFAEYLLVPRRFVQRSTHVIPAGLDDAIAALTEPLACVLHGLNACDLERYGADAGAEVVIYGAGPIGLLFVAALALYGHRVILADPNPGRLAVGEAMGAAVTIAIERGGGQADKVRKSSRGGAGVSVAVDCSGVPEVWVDAINTVQPGGLVNLFGGCATGTHIELDTHLLHYSELTVKGTYHHTPTTIVQALALLADPRFEAHRLLSARAGIGGVAEALKSMMRKETLKVVIQGP